MQFFLIGVKFEAVTNTVNRFCKHFQIKKYSASKELTTSDFLKLMKSININDLTENIYNNRQRTSSKNGILKSEAVIRFLEVLQNNKIETLKDIQVQAYLNLENQIKQIRWAKKRNFI